MSQPTKNPWKIRGALAVATVGVVASLAIVKSRQPDASSDPTTAQSKNEVTPTQQLNGVPDCNDMPTSITVAPCLPTDIPGGAPNASLQAAGVFAWQELIALSWPSVALTGTANTRGVPDPNKRLEAGQDENSSQLPTWATFRHKSEIFPGDGSRPHGPQGSSGYYDDPPRYIYDPAQVGSGYVQNGVPLAAGQIPACDDNSPDNVSEAETFITADENSQIGQDFMFAGKNEQQHFSSDGGNPEGRSQILFLVKFNRTYFDYIVSPQHKESWWQGIPPDVRKRTTDYLDSHKADPPAGSMDMVSFPNGTIMVKSAWRRATDEDRSSNRYFIKKVRYYERQESSKTYGGVQGDKNLFCYRLTPYALVGIHIVQKTPSAPYFIFASFEHADNLLTADGRPIEDENGEVLVPGQSPLTPAVTAVNATASKGQTFSPTTADCTPASSLYYRNTPSLKSLIQGSVCVRGRQHPIPSEIIEVNRQAHAALDAYAAPPPLASCNDEGLPCTSDAQCCSRRCNKMGFTSGCTGGTYQPPAPPVSRLRYYKLINVQTAPFDKPAGVDYQPSAQGPSRSTYYMANIVVETDYPLQVFSGALNTDGTTTDYKDGSPFKNTLYNGSGYNMGGCMGCHGVAQGRGGGFSFAFEGIIDANGNSEDFNTHPEPAEGVPTNADTRLVKRYERLRNEARK